MPHCRNNHTPSSSKNNCNHDKDHVRRFTLGIQYQIPRALSKTNSGYISYLAQTTIDHQLIHSYHERISDRNTNQLNIKMIRFRSRTKRDTCDLLHKNIVQTPTIQSRSFHTDKYSEGNHATLYHKNVCRRWYVLIRTKNTIKNIYCIRPI